MRLTYRTARVLMAIAERPGSNNREVGNRGEVVDQGQISKLLSPPGVPGPDRQHAAAAGAARPTRGS